MIFDFVICSSFFADMVELEDTSDLSSDGLYRAGSSPAIRTRRREFEHKEADPPLFQKGGGRGGQILKIKAEKAQKEPGGYKLPAGLFLSFCGPLRASRWLILLLCRCRSRRSLPWRSPRRPEWALLPRSAARLWWRSSSPHWRP